MILDFSVQGVDDIKKQEELKSKLKNALLKDIAYPVLSIEERSASPSETNKK